VRWLNLDGVIKAININGVTELIINKLDIMEKVGVFKMVKNGNLAQYETMERFKAEVESTIYLHTTSVQRIIWSTTPNGI